MVFRDPDASVKVPDLDSTKHEVSDKGQIIPLHRIPVPLRKHNTSQ